MRSVNTAVFVASPALAGRKRTRTPRDKGIFILDSRAYLRAYRFVFPREIKNKPKEKKDKNKLKKNLRRTFPTLCFY